VRSVRTATVSQDTLALAVAFALALHAVVIGLVHFEFLGQRPDRVPSSLDVILVDWATEEAPEEADFLAQASQRGSGDNPELERPAERAAAQLAQAFDAVEQQAQPQDRRDQPEQHLEQIQVSDEQRTPLDRDATEPDENPEIDSSQLVESARALARVSPERVEYTRDFAERPRRKFVSANTREHLYAAYMRSWVAKVERVGNLNYPERARRRNLAGSLVLSVDVMADGSVGRIRVLRSSGQEVLDEAAVRIVRLSAPFSPLPADIRQEADMLTITRTWQFSSTGQLRSGRSG